MCERLLILPLFLIVAADLLGQKNNDTFYHSTYKVGAIPELDKFKKLNLHEAHMDSMAKERMLYLDSLFTTDTMKYIDSLGYKDELMGKRDFINNRSRLFLETFSNDSLLPMDSFYLKGISAKCACVMDKDTLYFSTGYGFFSGFGFVVKIYGDSFKGQFYEYADDAKPFLYNMKDTTYYDQILVDNQYQYLILDKQPFLQMKQQINGYLTFSTKVFYEQTYNPTPDPICVRGILYFTCKTRKRLKFE